MEELSAAIHEIQDRFAIQDLITRFCHMVDVRILESVADDFFTPDAILNYGFKRMSGRDEIHNFYNSFDGVVLGTSHTVANPLVEIDGDSAKALHRVLGFHWHAQQGEIQVRAADELMVAGYQDRLQRTERGWRISERIIVQFGAGLGVGEVKPPFDAVMRSLLSSKAKWPF